MAGGEDTDGRGTEGMVEEKSREARAGETGTTRFGMADGDDKKKGDFDQWQRKDEGGDEKQRAKGESSSRTASKQNAGHGGHP